MLLKVNVNRCKALILLLVAASCGGDPYLYDRTGFDQDARPVVAPNPRAPNSVPPDYYQHQQQYGGYQQVPPQNYAPYPPAYHQPIYPQPAPVYQQYPQGGGSRYYSNPYAIPPAAGYYQRYDVDQYYVPPTYYNNSDYQGQRSNGDRGSGSTNY